MKLFILTFSILFLASCQQYRYDVTYEKCNGQTGSISYIGYYGLPPTFSDRDRYLITYGSTIRNVCDFSDRDRYLITYGSTIRNVCDFSYNSTPLQ